MATVLVLCGWTSLASAQTIHTSRGPFDVDLNLGAHVEAEYSDNIDGSETHPRSDLQLSVGPYVGGTVGFDLPSHLSTGQRFSLTGSMTYDAKYSVADGTWTKQLGSPIGVSVVLPFLISGWDVNLSDSFSYSDDHLQSTFGFNQQNTVQYNNTAGLSVGRRFGRYGLTLASDRRDVWSPDSPSTEETDYDFSVIPSYYFRNGMSVFAKTTVGFVYPDDITRRNVDNYVATAGVSGPLTPNVSGTVSAGWAVSHLQGKTFVDPVTKAPVALPDETVSGPALELNLSYAQALRPNTTHSLSVFHNPGITAALKDSDVQEASGVSYTISHRLNRYLILSPTVGWALLHTVAGTGPHEQVNIINVGMALQRSFGRQISTTLRYQFQTRESNLAGQSYDENRVTFDVLYIF